MTPSNLPLLHFHTLFLFLFLSLSLSRAALPGKWDLLMADAGIASMHTAVTHYGTVVLLDRTNIGPSRLPLNNNRCRNNPNDAISKHDCTAHSALFDPTTKILRPLDIFTDTWCSSGQFLPDGTLLQTGGDRDGVKKIRMLKPCGVEGLCDWEELNDVELAEGRWYATNQILPSGEVIIIGGRGTPSIEFYPPRGKGAIPFPFLADVADSQGDNLYPNVHLLPNGELFIFANNKAVLYDYNKNLITKNLPTLDGGPRSYPSAGSSVMLPLEGDFSKGAVLVCGGATYGAFMKRDNSAPAIGTCGRIVATDVDPKWEMEVMPFRRIMGDMAILPTGDILIMNGAQSGSQGFGLGSNPCLNPVLYRPNQPLGLRFTVMTPTTVPRMYHSTANLLPDGRVLVAGSNTHYFYTFNSEFPTELRLEAFSPEYLSEDRANLRPEIKLGPKLLRYGEEFTVEIKVALAVVGVVEVNMGNAPYATHSFSQGQRLLKLNVKNPVPNNNGGYTIGGVAPPNAAVAPPGYYMMFAVNQGVPSVAHWVKLG